MLWWCDNNSDLIKKKQTYILTGCREYLYISVFIWYEDSFIKMKRSNAHEVTLREVLEMLFVCLCPHWDVTRDSVCVCVCVCVCAKENARLISCIISAYEYCIAGSRSVKEISCTAACHSTAALLQTGTSTSVLNLHRHFLSARYLSGLSFSGEHER